MKECPTSLHHSSPSLQRIRLLHAYTPTCLHVRLLHAYTCLNPELNHTSTSVTWQPLSSAAGREPCMQSAAPRGYEGLHHTAHKAHVHYALWSTLRTAETVMEWRILGDTTRH